MNKYVPKKSWKTGKNDVSNFIAGFKAAMVLYGEIDPKDVERIFYIGTEVPNLVRGCYRDYSSKKTDTEGLEAMYEAIEFITLPSKPKSL